MTKVWNKKQTQSTIRALRTAGLVVDKSPSGMYTCKVGNKEVFAAIPGNNGYLVHFVNDLFIN